MSLKTLVRDHIKLLTPYASARSENGRTPRIALDANENPYPNNQKALYRYPDPFQTLVKEEIASLYNCNPKQIALGNGSDELIDLLYRALVEPIEDEVIICPPTYGMYSVQGIIHRSRIIEVPLTQQFQLDVEGIKNQLNDRTKIIFICSPNNPTGNLIACDDIEALLMSTNALVVIDEAYIDFSDRPSWISKLDRFENLCVLQTFSKSWGLAGIRLGVLFGNTYLIEIINKIKPPYNISSLSQQAAIEVLQSGKPSTQEVISERERLKSELLQLHTVKKIFPSDANFLLVAFEEHAKVFELLNQNGIIVRNRSHELHCEGCLRLTVGTRDENDELISCIQRISL